MEKINLPFFYQCGAQLNPLTKLTVNVNDRIPIYMASFPAHSYVYTLLDAFPVLTVCRSTGAELIKAILEMQKWVKDTPAEKLRELDSSVDPLFGDVVDKARQFETIVIAELQTLATYHVTQKGAYSTPDLIDRAEVTLPQSIQDKIPENVRDEIRECGRCLAFDNPTASGFHIIRAVEGIMHLYYLTVCKPTKQDRLESWGAYIAELRKLNDPIVKETIAILQQIKDNDRNLIMHPELTLSPDDAFTLFEIAKGAIMAMARSLPKMKAVSKGKMTKIIP